MNPPLSSLAPCFQGILPAQLFTCSSDGTPNAAYLSHVEYVDASHVALSFQFFNKSRRNIAENPQASVMVTDPDTGQGWLLRLEYERSETSGPLFDRMALRIEAIASYSGLKGVFKLRAADIYRVLDVVPADEEVGIGSATGAAALVPPVVFTPQALRALTACLTTAASVETLIDTTLEVFDQAFGFRHSMLLVPSDQETSSLVAVATRGYSGNGIGAEMRWGEGIGGLVAEAQAPIRISGLVRGMLYALAMHRRAHEPDVIQRTRQIAVPALDNPDSVLGIPLLAHGDLLGVLCLESERPYRYHDDDRACVEVIGALLGLALQQAQWYARAIDDCVEAVLVTADESAPASAESSLPLEASMSLEAPLPSGPQPRPDAPPAVTVVADARPRTVAYHAFDECILVDDDYLIRGVPARILWRLLRVREASGRDEFSNRELRLDKSLGLPEWKDNLESRLILLRRRLDQKTPWMRLVPRSRGRFALEVVASLQLVER